MANRKLLEKIINHEDIKHIAWFSLAGFVGTAIYSSIGSSESIKDLLDISHNVWWREAYWKALKETLLNSRYSLPLSAGIGYVFSKTKQVIDYMKDKKY